MKSQDTLYMANGEKIPSQIIEISHSGVKYKKLNNIDGPTYSSENPEVKYIKFKNGAVDTIKSSPKAPEVLIASDQTQTYSDKEIEKKPSIYFSGDYYRFNGKEMKESEIHMLIQEKKDREIGGYVNKSKNAKQYEYVGFVAIPAIIYGVFHASETYKYNKNVANTPYGVVAPSAKSYGQTIVAGILGVVSLTTTIISKPIRRKNTEAAIRIYNERY